jgi:A/G-specific adenine glycosylase
MSTSSPLLPRDDLERLHHEVMAWFASAARDLPWRRDVSPWAVMVSEFMLQQTPVARVLPVYEAWVRRWPTAADLAAEPVGEAVRAWGRLGYPRRALRLHAAATAIVDRHGGEVPSDRDDLLALPGVGDYTAAAIASFAFGGRAVVMDTNVRRVLARVVAGVEHPAPGVTAAERGLATALVPDHDAHVWAVPRWSSGRSCAPRARRSARSARSPTCAAGGRPATLRTRARRAAVSRGRAPTVSAAVACWR